MIQLNLSNAQFSDLYFNHEHPKRDEVYKRYENQKDAPTPEELEAAALKDAAEFVELYSVPQSPDVLAADFLARV